MIIQENDNNVKSKIFHLSNNVKQISEPSIDINQVDEYPLSTSQKGIISGKVTSNGGVAIPNAKISIFLSTEENEEPYTTLYPYQNIFDKNQDGFRYNLLNKKKNFGSKKCYNPTGSFFTKSEILSDPFINYIHSKYYKFTAVTNNNGDYVITDLPLGLTQVHVDIDISDIGFLSQKPYDLIASGASENLFESLSVFKKSQNLDTLPQIFSFDTTTDVLPTWSQVEEKGITRLDIDLPLNIVPTAFIVFGNFTDSLKGAVAKSGRARRKTGRNCELESRGGTVTILRKISDDSNEVEILNSQTFKIDSLGNAVIPVPMNLNKMVTDNTGNLVPSNDLKNGIATTAKIRLKVTLDDYDNVKKRTASYLVPNLYNDFTFDNNTPERDFFEVKRNNIYTVTNYIPRIQKTKQQTNENYIGIKRIGECEDNLSMPFNRVQSEFNILYSILCLIINTFVLIADIIDTIVELVPFTGEGLTFECDGVTYDDAKDWRDECVMPKIADFFGVIEYEFYNDFLTGSLYHFKWRFKAKYKSNKDAIFYKYSAYNCRDYVSSNDPSAINRCRELNVVDRRDYNNGADYFISDEATRTFNRGLIVEYNNDFFYAARNDVNINSPSTQPLNLNASVTEKNKLLFGTDFINLGITEQCATNEGFFILDFLESTTFEEEEGNNFLYNIGNFSSCFRPNNIEELLIYKISQFGTEVIGGEEDDLDGNYYLDHQLVSQRRELSQAFNTYGLFNYFIEAPDLIVSPSVGDDIVILTNSINNLEGNSIIRAVSPYFHFFGLKNSKTSLDVLKNNFLC